MRGLVYNLLVQLLLVPASAVTLGSKSHKTHDHIFIVSNLRFPKPGRPGPSIFIPQEQGGPVIPLGTGFPFVASYDSQGCGGGILIRLHKGTTNSEPQVLFICPRHGQHRKRFFHYFMLYRSRGSNLPTELFPSSFTLLLLGNGSTCHVDNNNNNNNI
jgi:hypothetical protein